MKHLSIIIGFFTILCSCTSELSQHEQVIMTVTGPKDINQMGLTFEHEHIATDFIGAEKVKQPQYPVSQGTAFFLPHLMKLKDSGVQTLIECTPEYIGRDVKLLRELSEQSGVNILTNTGYYAAVDKKYLPKHTFNETAEQLAARWIDEWENGINGTDIKPGFIKLGVGKKSLDSIEQKIVRAGALAHLSTGLKIAIHTGSSIAANDELDILDEVGVDARALIVVHAQNATSEEQIKLIKRGCWISLDGVNQKPETIARYIDFLLALKQENLLGQVLISHDDGWSVVQKEDGSIGFELFKSGDFSPYSTIFELLFPRLKELGFTQKDFDQLLIKNPGKAFMIEVCERR